MKNSLTFELTSSYNWTFDIPFHTGETAVALEAIAKVQPRRCWNNPISNFLEDFDPWETGIMVVFEPPFFLLITMNHLHGHISCPSLQRARALLSSFSVFGLLKAAEAELQQSSLGLWSLGTMDSLCI